MPLLTKVGSFVKSTSLGAQAVTGLGFQPKAIIFWVGPPGASGAWQSQVPAGIGFTTGATNSYAISAASGNGVTTSLTGRRMAAKAITIVRWDLVSDDADLQSFDADGFTINWTSQDWGVANNINYLALGGSDITGAKVITWGNPTTAGVKAVTGVGFKPDLVFNAGAQVTTALPYVSTPANLDFGVMNKHGQQWGNSITMQNNVNPSNTSRWQQTDACIAGVESTDQINRQAHFVSMDSDGFSTHFSHTSGTVLTWASLCLKGVSSKIGAFAKTTAAAPAAQSIERIGFQPKAVLASGISTSSQAAPLSRATFNLGVSDGTNNRATALHDNDAVSPTQAHSIWYSDKAVTLAGDGPTDFGSSTITFDTDGFSLSFNPNPSWTAEILYLALGDAGIDTFPAKVA